MAEGHLTGQTRQGFHRDTKACFSLFLGVNTYKRQCVWNKRCEKLSRGMANNKMSVNAEELPLRETIRYCVELNSSQRRKNE